MHYIGVQTAL